MSHLDAAIGWYQAQKERLDAIDGWIRAGMTITKELKPFLEPYASNIGSSVERKKKALDQLREATEDVERMALVRLFGAFEADFRLALAAMLRRACGRLRPSSSGKLAHPDQIVDYLPTMKECMPLGSALEPSFSSSDRNALEKIRGFRNDVMHRGFNAKPADDVEDVAAICSRVLGRFVEGHDSPPPEGAAERVA